MNKYFPSTAANPTNLVYKLSVPAWQDATAIEKAGTQLTAAKDVFTGVSGPLNPVGGAGFTPAQYTQLHALLGSGPLPATAPAEPAAAAAAGVTAAQWSQAYQLYRATAQYVSADGKTIQFDTSLTAGDPSTTAALNAVPAVRAAAATVVPVLHATDYGVAGEAPAIYDINAISNSDLAHVIPIAIIVIGVLLALVMRSLVAPLYLIASVALSYFAALGLAVLIFIELGNSGGITFILPFLLFIFLLALGEDYNILVMTRIREEAHHLPLREAVTRAVGVTGTTVTSAGLVLAGTFAVFALVGGRLGRLADQGNRLRPRARRHHGHVRGPHRARALYRGAARPLELVAVQAAHGLAGRRDGPGGSERGRARAVPAGRPVRREHRPRVTQKILIVAFW